MPEEICFNLFEDLERVRELLYSLIVLYIISVVDSRNDLL